MGRVPVEARLGDQGVCWGENGLEASDQIHEKSAIKSNLEDSVVSYTWEAYKQEQKTTQGLGPDEVSEQLPQKS